MSKKRLPEIPVDPPEDYFAAIGEVAVRWARLEYQIGVMARVGFGLGKDEQRSLLVGMSLTVLTSVLRAVAEGWLRDGGLAQRIREFASDIGELRNNRGDYVHGLFGHWLGEPDAWFMFNLKSPKQRGQIGTTPISPAKIRELATELRALQVRAQELTTEMKAAACRRSGSMARLA